MIAMHSTKSLWHSVLPSCDQASPVSKQRPDIRAWSGYCTAIEADQPFQFLDGICLVVYMLQIEWHCVQHSQLTYTQLTNLVQSWLCCWLCCWLKQIGTTIGINNMPEACLVQGGLGRWPEYVKADSSCAQIQCSIVAYMLPTNTLHTVVRAHTYTDISP